ncbi:MAG: hopanoid biosynthesis-associated protein HpnK [Chromatiaceae bacterium]
MVPSDLLQGSGPRRVIVTADDFGMSRAVNEAVETAHRMGIVRAASLMVGAAAAEDAVTRAKRLPQLGVGLHLVLVDGCPVLPPAQVAGLTDAAGRFPKGMFLPSVRLFFSPARRRQAQAEIRAQFEAFRATGLSLDHVNAHKHLHLHPTVLALILEIGPEFGMKAVRLPNEPLPRLRLTAPGAWVHWLLWRVFIGPWMSLLRWRLRRAGMRSNDFVFGLSKSGAMDETTLLALLDDLPPGITEVYFHPGVSAADGTGAADELRALTSPAVRETLARQNLRPCSFSDLREPTEMNYLQRKGVRPA